MIWTNLRPFTHAPGVDQTGVDKTVQWAQLSQDAHKALPGMALNETQVWWHVDVVAGDTKRQKTAPNRSAVQAACRMACAPRVPPADEPYKTRTNQGHREITAAEPRLSWLQAPSIHKLLLSELHRLVDSPLP